DIASRDSYLEKIQTRLNHIVFSSYTALEHYKKFYPKSTMEKYVIQFCSVIDFALPEKRALEEKYGIDSPYFICSNQFWKHKNHELVFRALAFLKKQGSLNFKMIFTGKEEDPRNPEYFGEIKKFVLENQLSDDVSFLGFISREDQLGLMQNAMAVVQPSLFEGWGTVVEDAKTLGVQVLCSDIAIHHEQLEDSAYYFDSVDEKDLAEKMNDFVNHEITEKHHYLAVNERLKESAKAIIHALT
ncbi:MAG: glycosyltransferase, partial [Crocinitomicaceae bacterium]|nr:glycosyltransferase [Crocinitomicaceae bacterium]